MTTPIKLDFVFAADNQDAFAKTAFAEYEIFMASSGRSWGARMGLGSSCIILARKKFLTKEQASKTSIKECWLALKVNQRGLHER